MQMLSTIVQETPSDNNGPVRLISTNLFVLNGAVLRQKIKEINLLQDKIDRC